MTEIPYLVERNGWWHLRLKTDQGGCSGLQEGEKRRRQQRVDVSAIRLNPVACLLARQNSAMG